ncbi:hypothetical protein E3N88_27857 [Mikania micrantha]|uniref:Uncharacterized protein n=1 Tax=Mikania micrantha TaxID=192012 RepID=A0A5N6MYU6_9ASTR|nr:hypothetical protein E3N88_27857 [Mikania micrantha]
MATMFLHHGFLPQKRAPKSFWLIHKPQPVDIPPPYTIPLPFLFSFKIISGATARVPEPATPTKTQQPSDACQQLDQQRSKSWRFWSEGATLNQKQLKQNLVLRLVPVTTPPIFTTTATTKTFLVESEAQPTVTRKTPPALPAFLQTCAA